MLRELNDRFPLAGRVLSADALHTQRKLAALICEDLLAHFIFTVKGNQPGLRAALEGLCWAGAAGTSPAARDAAAARPARTWSWTSPTR